MRSYINGMSCLSPLETWDDLPLSDSLPDATNNRLKCIEPDYSTIIDPRTSRRMSRIIKMGVASGLMALRRAGIENPEGIITGTGYGCQEDTSSFLQKIDELHEEALNPTPFIQSTHNTIGGQLSLLLQCQAYNQTYAHGAFSFESALIDAALQLEEEPSRSLLVGGIDESVDLSHKILDRLGVLQRTSAQQKHSGIVNGEGAAFFVLSGMRNENSIACLEAVTTVYKPQRETLHVSLRSFLESNNSSANEVDLVLKGTSGMQAFDLELDQLIAATFPTASTAVFKPCCGEYPVATAFATWLAAKIIQTGAIPTTLYSVDRHRNLESVLVVNHYFGEHYSFILLKKC